MRILFTCVSGQSHFYNTVPLAFAARALGHDVAYSSALELAPIVEAAGLPLLPAGPGRLRLRAAMTRSAGIVGELDLEDWSRGAALFGCVGPALRWRALSEVAQRYRPHAIVSEPLELAGPLVALRLGISHFTLSIGPYYADTMSQLWAQAAPLYREHAGADITRGQALGCYIDVVPPELQTREGLRLADRIPAGCRLYHGEAGQAPGEEPERGPRPLALMTFGTVSNKALSGLWESAARLSRRGMDVLMTTGPNGWFDFSAVRGAESAAGDGAIRVVDYTPLDRELPRSAVVIHHGGSNTMRAAIGAEVPSLVIPQEAEQHRNARWAAEHGLGLLLRPEAAEPSAVEGAVARLLADPAFAERLGAARAAFSAMPSAEAAVEEMARRCETAPHQKRI
ncbi:glycosyltransferase family 1 protein [Actinocrinis puniceicyclus]|uniref:Glycosyltransferase family 1 protein n=1 Tax=Actinocrinis puniceicyclus TaxID=977794 RepID=A0A8J7WV46_9ACTN|nr:glycosyltransferase [Actinocrinis puniceicyclus]MBS2966482.1 glycosyltransferase family 1 protein [Actinocrinis puniceicyclus]